MEKIIDKTVAIVLVVDESPHSIVGFDISIFDLEASKEQEQINILNKAMDKIKTYRGFYKFINWFRPKRNEDQPDEEFHPRTKMWEIERTIIPKTIQRIYIKNLRITPYYVAMDRMSPEGIMTKVHCTLRLGEWAYIENEILRKY